MNSNYLKRNRVDKPTLKTGAGPYSARRYVYLLICLILLMTVITTCFIWWQINKFNKIEMLANEYHLSTMLNSVRVKEKAWHIASHAYGILAQDEPAKKPIYRHFFNLNTAFFIMKEKIDTIKELQRRHNHQEYANTLKNADKLLSRILVVRENVDFAVAADVDEILKMLDQLNIFMDQLQRQHTIAYEDLMSNLLLERPKIPRNISLFLFSLGIIGFLVIGKILNLIRLAEEELGKHRQHLQELVEERTNELIGVNEKLKQEIVEHEQAEEEKKRLAAQLQQAQKLESVGTLAGGIAHDFNNLLSIIMGNISMAKDDVKPEHGVTEFLDEAEKASLLARDLTKQLITFSKGGAPVKKISYISNLIEKATNFALSGSNLGCEFNTPDDLWPVEIDEGQIRHVINNVVINAVQAMPKGGTIKVCAKNIVSGTDKDYEGLSLPDGNYVKISIRDQGTGISDKDLPMIFDPYYSSKERGTQKGMGLGLATSYSIIKQHKGEITAQSKLGVRTTINIYLPASEIEVPVKKKLEEKVIVGKGRILIMDDEEMIRDVLSQMLRRLGYEVESSKDGTEAIESYKKAMKSDNPFDAVMLDLTVRGGMGGRDAIQKLIEIDPDVNGIVNSGHSDDPVMTYFKKYDFCSAIAKPFSMPELSVILDKVITDTDVS